MKTEAKVLCRKQFEMSTRSLGKKQGDDFQPEKYVDEFGETQTQAPPNSLEDTEDSIMLKIIKKAAKNVKKSDEK
ncbi:unnamed protein product [Caenorhabditis angaria]|uniref:Uncharacterized protein n=1 Tax=Caenorhabditis angaria TaxID=860376 RepID=A0A9P1IDR4_9PELO|nr:unnamed protein product [Caenorhabditis angaria]